MKNQPTLMPVAVLNIAGFVFESKIFVPIVPKRSTTFLINIVEEGDILLSRWRPLTKTGIKNV